MPRLSLEPIAWVDLRAAQVNESHLTYSLPILLIGQMIPGSESRKTDDLLVQDQLPDNRIDGRGYLLYRETLGRSARP